MCCLVFVFVMAALLAPGHSLNKDELDQIMNLIKMQMQTPKEEEQKKEQKEVSCVEKSAAPVSCGDKIADLEARLVDMENEMDEIISYLSSEKLTDKILKTNSDIVIAKMEAKERKADKVIAGLNEEVFYVLDDLENMIQEVNKSAQVTINSKGVIFYGRVGSPCSTVLDDCLDHNAECRDGKCQCIPGYSFDVTGKMCVESCAEYGSTYQTISRQIIRGHNNHVLNGTDVDAKQCKDWCNDATDFLCKSIDFFPRWNLCFFSNVTMVEVDEDAVEYSSVGVHFQRDCE